MKNVLKGFGVVFLLLLAIAGFFIYKFFFTDNPEGNILKFNMAYYSGDIKKASEYLSSPYKEEWLKENQEFEGKSKVAEGFNVSVPSQKAKEIDGVNYIQAEKEITVQSKVDRYVEVYALKKIDGKWRIIDVVRQ